MKINHLDDYHCRVEKYFEQSKRNGVIRDCDVKYIGRLPGDASTRIYYRITTNAGQFVVCIESAREKLHESNFVLMNKVLTSDGIRVPKIFDYDYSSGYILQEDLGDQTLLKAFSQINDIGEEYDLLERAIDWMIKIHEIDTKKYPKNEFATQFFDQEKLMSEVMFGIKHFFGNFLKHEIPNSELKIITDTFIGICQKLAEQKMVLCHRDFHSRNIMMRNDSMVIIDFQDARMGIPQYDLVSILEDCYYKVHPQNVENLKKYYWNTFLESKNLQNSYGEFDYLYCLMAIQRIFKAIGSFSFFVTQKQDYRYLKYIGFAMEKLKEFFLCDSEYNNCRKIIYSHYYEN